jgi:hypothetical protein
MPKQPENEVEISNGSIFKVFRKRRVCLNMLKRLKKSTLYQRVST